MGLGGSKTQTATSTSGIDPEFKPHLSRALGQATDLTFGDQATKQRLRGELGAGQIAGQQEVRGDIDTQRALAQQAVAGTGIYDNEAAVQRQLQNLQGQQLAGGQGTLGSARADRARQAALADQALQFQQARQQQAATGAGALGKLGQQRRALEQEAIDAPHQSLQRYFGYLGNVGQQSTQTSPKQGK